MLCDTYNYRHSLSVSVIPAFEVIPSHQYWTLLNRFATVSSMFEHYRASEVDFRGVEEGIEGSWQDELSLVFANKKLLARILIVSYDSKFLYLWSCRRAKCKEIQASSIQCYLNDYRAYKATHGLNNLSDDVQSHWRAGLLPKSMRRVLEKVLGKVHDVPLISGGLQTPFVTLQERKRHPHNPYVTRMGFAATIVHELAHGYFDQHRLWWFSSKRQSLEYLRAVKVLYDGGRKLSLPRLPLRAPNYGVRHTFLSETFAYCAEYTAASKLWSPHQVKLDQSNSLYVQELLLQERKRVTQQDYSVLDEVPGHAFACVIGRLLLNQFPRDWPKKLIGSTALC